MRTGIASNFSFCSAATQDLLVEKLMKSNISEMFHTYEKVREKFAKISCMIRFSTKTSKNCQMHSKVRVS